MAPVDAGPPVRASDAERDAVVSELGQHFQDGRLDSGEHEQRVASALTASTRRELAALLTDLPSARPATEPAPAAPWPGYRRLQRLRPAVLAVVVVTLLIAGGWSHGRAGGWPFAPLAIGWLVLVLATVRGRIRGGRRQWR
jgi:Domain of unknown function (DUF1707)